MIIKPSCRPILNNLRYEKMDYVQHNISTRDKGKGIEKNLGSVEKISFVGSFDAFV
jgi:hypothetical protein